MARRLLAVWIAGGICVSSVAATAAGDNRQGAQLAATCASCHRLDGRDMGIPAIIGREAGKLVAMMRTFKSDESTNHIMHAVSLSLSNDEITGVAAYLATLGKEAKQP